MVILKSSILATLNEGYKRRISAPEGGVVLWRKQVMTVTKAYLEGSTEARAAFETKLVKEADGLLSCWPQTIRAYLRGINNIVFAGRSLKVTEAQAFTVEEIDHLVAELTPLAELEMHDAVKQILFPVFEAKSFGGVVMKKIEESLAKK